MIMFTHPCGHEDEIDEEQWYRNEGDAPWDCPVCTEARQQEWEANAAFLAPLRTYLQGYGPLLDRLPDPEDVPYDWAPDAAEQRRIDTIHSLLQTMRTQAIGAIEAGLEVRAQALAAEGRPYPDWTEEHQAPLQVQSLLSNLEGAYQRLHNDLWCAENGIQPWEGAQAFWMFDVEQAEERLVAEMWRRSCRYRVST